MILFFYGPNSFEARQQIGRLVKQYVEKSGSDFGLERVDSQQVALGELRATLQAVPFLANSRLVVIENLGANKSIAAKVGDLVAEIPNTTVAVFYDPSVDQRTSYFKTLKEKAKVVEFKLLDQSKLQRWIQQRVGEAQGSIERPAIGRLLELAGEDQWRLAGEIDKLVNYANPITVQAVNDLVESSKAESIFNLVDCMTAGKRQQAVKIYHKLRSDGENEVYILSMVIWQLRNQLLAKVAGKITAPQLAKEGGMSPYVAGKMLAKRHLYTEEQLKQAFIRAVDTDMAIKTGEGEGDYLVEQLIANLAAESPAAK